MPVPAGTRQKESDSSKKDEAAQDLSAEAERLVHERTAELQKEIDALRRENARLLHTETILRENEEHYRNLVELSPDAILLHREGCVAYANPAALRLFKASSPEDLIGKRSLELTPPEYRRTILHRMQRLQEKGRTEPCEVKVFRLDGQIVDVETTGSLVDWAGVPYEQIVMRDITERKRAESELLDLKKKLEAEVEDLKTLSTLSAKFIEGEDFDSLLREMLEAAITLTGADKGNIQLLDPSTGKLKIFAQQGLNLPFLKFFEYVDPGESAACGAAMERLERVVVEDVTLSPIFRGSEALDVLQREGVRAVQSTPLVSRTGQLLGMISTHFVKVHALSERELQLIDILARQAADILERKRTEDALRHRTDDLIRLNEEVEAARDETNMYLDIMTHDVRNANNVSGMYADLLVDLLAGDQWLYARKLRDAIQRSTEILRNVATIRRLQEESNHLVPMNLDTAVREEIGNFPGVSIRYDGRRVGVLADTLLPVIFTNLLGNAVKFGGPDVEIAIDIEEQGGEVLVTVADTGPGVPEEMKQLLFRRFERGVAKGRGEGLGLYIIRTLMERYGGKVWVEDRVPRRPEEGASFKFTLRKATEQ
jgi:PAS domain S-box-containing protein